MLKFLAHAERVKIQLKDLATKAYGWQQSMVTQNAKAVQEASDALYAKLVNVHEYIEKVGANLSTATAQYNRFVGAIEGRGGTFFLMIPAF